MRRLTVIAWAVLAAFVLLAAAPAFAQNDVTLDLEVGADSTLTWSTTPDAAVCEASGDWSGEKAASGSESVGRITSSSSFALACSWPGESLATLTWANPTENTDGSPYEDAQATRIAWAEGEGSTDAFDCLEPSATPDIETTDRPAEDAMHTITGLTPGTWEFVAFAVNDVGLCSAPSNAAQKQTTGDVETENTISVTIPSPISGLSAE